MVNIIRGSADKYASTKSLVEFFQKKEEIEGTLYLGYPIIGSVDGAINIDAMLVSKEHGVVIIDLVEGTEFEDRLNIQDDLFNKAEAKLRDYNSLKDRRKFMVEIGVITYASGWRTHGNKDGEFEWATNHQELEEMLSTQVWENEEYFSHLLEAIQAVTKIKSKPKRDIKDSSSKGAILKMLDDSISNLDSNQSAAVIETVDGPQRVRGLAGSGKTIVLALKVAYLHAMHPDWNIAVTFNTRSLKKQFQDLITKFTYEHKREEPDWNKVNIIQAWGSSRNEGIYYNVCKEHGIEYYTFDDADRLTYSRDKRFEMVCKKALNEIDEFKPLYDLILIDEAQDFSGDFLLLCYEILTKEKRLIFAYDELQTLNKKSMLSPEEIFGTDEKDKPRVILRNEPDKPKQDIILQVCYRNSRPILATAHALGFGVYYPEDALLIQMFGEKNLWREVGYDVLEGELADGKKVKLSRSSKASPEFLEHSPIDELIQFHVLKDEEEQAEWLAQNIKKNIEKDELRYQDIMVIHTDPLTTQSAASILRKKLYKLGINSHIAGSNDPDIFKEKDSITITGIYRAKGNEAGMVYVMNGQYCYTGQELIKKRNILFTALTRSKSWVRVTGIGNNMEKLKLEYQSIKDKNFELDFTYPTEEERKTMNLINRDMTIDEKRKIKSTIENLTETVKSIQEGTIYLEDLPEGLRQTLQGLLKDE
ncbi:DEAD/DEAH box helicase [Peribacillus sp. YIM B13477]|uniref:DEAD/DEAH box helicase n=1 Tax=Peribacillus sp. YIM B13477 TaxID=3366300 RepID=UPI003672C8C3